MEKKAGRVFLYTICFACIMLIDFTRGSLAWKYWAPFVNMTGIVMSVIMLSHFSLKRVPLKKYLVWFLIWLPVSGIGYILWQRDSYSIFVSQYVTGIIVMGCLGVVAVHLWQERKSLQNGSLGNPFLVALWVVLSVLMLFSRLSEFWPMWYLVMFGMFYLIPFTKAEKDALWDGAANGVILGFFLLQIFAYGFRPYDAVRYSGAYSNCNINAMMYLAAFIMTLYKLHCLYWEKGEGKTKRQTRKRRLLTLFYVVLAGGLFSFILFTMARTALLVAVAILVVFGILEAWILRKMKWWKLVLRAGALCLCVVLTFPVVYVTIRYLPTILTHPVWFGSEYNEAKVHSFDPYDSTKYISWEEAMQTMLGRFYLTSGEGLEEDNSISKEETTILLASNNSGAERQILASLTATATDGEQSLTEEADALLSKEDSINSVKVRLAIYEKYWKHLNLTGHTQQEGYFQITENYHAWHAQNVFLQVAFYHGIPAGICLVLLILGLGIKALKLGFKGRRREDILPLFIILFFVGYGMFETVWYLGQSVLFFMYLVPKILIDSRTEEII